MDHCEYDFNRICRACKCESTNMCSVFERNEATGRNARLDEMLMACASVQVNCIHDGNLYEISSLNQNNTII